MRLKTFDGLSLSSYVQQSTNWLTFKESGVQIAGMAGLFDSAGDEQRREALRLDFQAVVVGATSAAVDTAIDALKAKANLGLCWLVAEMRDASERGTWAKLTQVDTTRSPDNYADQKITLTFRADWPWWEDTDDVWYFDAGYELDSGLSFDGNYTTQSGAGTFSINNTGDDVITRGIILVSGASTDPTITNTTTGESIAYDGTVGAGETLQIDIGAMQVWLDGTDAYADITLGSNQTRFMSLAVGTNSITFAGGGTLRWHWAKVY